MKKLFALLSVVSLFVFAESPVPKLVVFISVDQMRPDYFERYGHLFTGGLHTLYTKGIVYTNADLNYATSETGPGHATLSTGCFPAKNGIIGNEWIDPETKNTVYCVEDTAAKTVDGDGGGYSSKNLVVPTIGDWLKGKSKESKVVSISSKDRAAILMGGKNPDKVFWYGKKKGAMVASDFYMKTLPEWAKTFNASGWIEKNVPDVWTKSLPESVYAKIGPDEFPAEQQWNDNTSFPHAFTPGKKHEQIMGTPYGDALLIDFTITAVTAEQLGKRGVTDVLCLSLSNCDYVGHGFGPDSHELLDLLVNLDKQLGRFFQELDENVGENNYVVALSADHAVCPLPEYNVQFRNIAAKRYLYNTDIKPKLDSLSSLLKYELNTSEDVIIKNSFINYTLATKDRWDSVKLEQEITKGLKNIEAFVEVYFRHELISAEASDKPFIQKYRNSYYAPRGEDFQYRIRENCVISSRPSGTTHGSPYRYDTHVPLIVWRHGIQPQKVSRPVYSADAAPTLATIAGISIPKNIDGTPLVETLK
ncbi:MAG: alkaline phosphatase family protein [Bacteriovoracaceae bacterium]|nr:alkaline phosphatase family protein [Bacteroidota bacterium]